MISGPGGATLSYNALGQLVRTAGSSGIATRFVYDGPDLDYGGAWWITGTLYLAPSLDQKV